MNVLPQILRWLSMIAALALAVLVIASWLRRRSGGEPIASRWLMISAGLALVLGALGFSMFFVPDGQRAVVFSASDYQPRDADPSTTKLDGYGPGLHFTLPFLETISFYSFEPATAALAAVEQDQVAEAITTTEPATALATETALPSDTPMPSPTAQGGGTGQLAFASNRSVQFQIYLLDPAAPDDVLQLTDLEGGACQPDWAPDGRQLVFISPCTQNKDEYDGSFLYLINTEVGDPTELGIEGYDPDWSPDGSRIAVTVMEGGFRPQIYLYDVANGSFGNLSNTSGHEFMPAWSPDGNHIAFVSTSSSQRQIYTMDLNGENKQFFSRSNNRSNSHPVWTPDGEAIVFIQSPLSGGFPVLRIASWVGGGSDRGRDEADLANGGIPMREVAISPDGSWLLFSSNPDGANHDAYMIGIHSGAPMPITSDEALDFDPDWRP